MNERYDCFKLRHGDHPQSELIHYVGKALTIAEIEARLPKNHVTHIWVEKQWKKVDRSER